MKTPTLLLILDGLGFREEEKYNAVAQANTPTLDYLKKHYPHTLIKASGPAVGLLPGMMGNSEVGHLTIGSGRIIKQPIVQLHDLIDSQQLIKSAIIQKSFSELAHTGKTLHLIGLLSNAGVHSHIKHLFAFIDYAHYYGIKSIAIHPLLDGRDTPPQSSQKFLHQLEDHIKNIPEAHISSLCGRFYAMDRNKEWDRTKRAYDVLTTPQPIEFKSWKEALKYYYDQNVTDEFIPPTQLTHDGIIHQKDGVLFFNYRPDRARQLTAAFIQPKFTAFKRTKLTLAFFITPTIYDATLPTQHLLNKNEIKNTLMEILYQNNLSTFSIAETEKYAHVTYFFNANREKIFPTEQRVIIPSITADTYKYIPEMQADKITQSVLNSLKTEPQDFYLINYANPDMVAHSGNFKATKKAVECVDQQIKKLYEQIIKKMNGTLYITADHGNAEIMWDEKNDQPHTSHTNNPVEFIDVNQALKDKKIQLPLKELKDIAPFILQNLKIKTPKEMS
jgi:2,3-bisphosphoglycerate-independent phosphoglycerate mutase